MDTAALPMAPASVPRWARTAISELFHRVLELEQRLEIRRGRTAIVLSDLPAPLSTSKFKWNINVAPFVPTTTSRTPSEPSEDNLERSHDNVVLSRYSAWRPMKSVSGHAAAEMVLTDTHVFQHFWQRPSIGTWFLPAPKALWTPLPTSSPSPSRPLPAAGAYEAIEQMKDDNVPHWYRVDALHMVIQKTEMMLDRPRPPRDVIVLRLLRKLILEAVNALESGHGSNSYALFQRAMAMMDKVET